MGYYDHDIYQEGDADAPACVKDRNGDVVLNLCRRCGKGEVELYGACTPKPLDVVVVPRETFDGLVVACKAFAKWDRQPHLTDSSLEWVREKVYSALAKAEPPRPEDETDA